MEQKGKCPHGEFLLAEGCPQCIAERKAAGEEKARTIVELVEETGVPADNLKIEVQDDGSVDFTMKEEAPDTAVETVDIGYGIRALPGGDVVAVVKVGPGKDAVVVKLLEEVMRIKEYADKRVVQSPQDSKDAVNDIKGMGDLKKAIEEKRQEYVGPLNAHVKAVNDDFKLLTGPLAEADKVTRGKVTAYNNEMQRRQREAEEINRAKDELARKEAALNQGVFTVDTTPVNVPHVPKLTRAETATAGMVDNWKWEVVDFDAVPKEYKVVDDAMLNSIAKTHHDRKQVPGVRFYNEPTLRVSSR
uniref:Uncharacterized protein n=4 Tax=viral metagenome TaxID=1070528 RepID=A0A6M3J7T7_9ZZZZ